MSDHEPPRTIGELIREGAEIAGKAVLTVGAIAIELARIIDHDHSDCDCEDCRKDRGR